MTAGRQARRAADVGFGSSVEIAISQIPISLHFRLSQVWQRICIGKHWGSL